MSKKAYIGVNNVSELVKKAYIGVNNISKKVKKIYYGVNNTAKLVYSQEVATIPLTVSGSGISTVKITRTASPGGGSIGVIGTSMGTYQVLSNDTIKIECTAYDYYYIIGFDEYSSTSSETFTVTSATTKNYLVGQKPFLRFTALEPNSTVSYTAKGVTVNIQSSNNGVNWSNWNGDTKTLTPGQPLFIRNTTNTLSVDGTNNVHFSIAGRINAEGHVNSLINWSRNVPDNSFYGLFKSCSGLYLPPQLPSLTVGNSSYREMFMSCTNLLICPELPATTLNQYCYREMFSTCTNLQNVMETLPSTTVPYFGYNFMFKNCKAIMRAPIMPKFNESSSLSSSSISNMFYGCSNLKVRIAQGGNVFLQLGDVGSTSTKASSMFTGTGGSVTGTPQANTSYEYY